MTQTTVFQSGNSQAVRLPKAFRFTSKTVEIFRRGNEVVLREKPRTLGELLDSLPPVSAEDAAAMDAMLAAIKEPLPPDTRMDSWLKAAPAPTKNKARTSGSGSATAKPQKRGKRA
jgi:antitoxin VapB